MKVASAVTVTVMVLGVGVLVFIIALGVVILSNGAVVVVAIREYLFPSVRSFVAYDSSQIIDVIRPWHVV